MLHINDSILARELQCRIGLPFYAFIYRLLATMVVLVFLWSVVALDGQCKDVSWSFVCYKTTLAVALTYMFTVASAIYLVVRISITVLV